MEGKIFAVKMFYEDYDSENIALRIKHYHTREQFLKECLNIDKMINYPAVMGNYIYLHEPSKDDTKCYCCSKNITQDATKMATLLFPGACLYKVCKTCLETLCNKLRRINI